MEPLVLDVVPQSRWEVSAEVTGFWVARKIVKAGAASGEAAHISLDLWPLGSVAGTVKIKGQGIPLPKQLLVKTLAAPSILKRPTGPSGAIDCPVDEKGRWKCSLPAAQYDLVISAEGLTPAYRWGVRVPAGEPVTVGTVELQKGSSLAAWVAVEAGALSPESCEARLTPLIAGGAGFEAGEELRRTVVRTAVRKDGFLQMTGLTPGVYSLKVGQNGYPPVTVSPVRIEPGAETFLREPVILRAARDFTFVISPAQDWLNRPWRAKVYRQDDSGKPAPLVWDGGADTEGRFAVSGQPAGRYRIQVIDSRGNPFLWTERLLGETDAGPEPLEVEVVTVEGRLTLGNDPLAASLWFGGRSGAVSIHLDSDREGRFHGALPKAGPWRIEIEAAEPALQTWAREEVQAGRSGKARLDLHLPDTRVFGRVVDEKGQPVPEATVLVHGETFEQLQKTGNSGSFEARALPAGSVWLGAEAGKGASGRTFVTLAEDAPVGPLELRLRPVENLKGLVTSSRGPVPGARVLVLSKLPDGGGGLATTGLDGAFTLEMPRVSPQVIAVVSAPGFPLRAFDAAPPLDLPLAEEGGDLEILGLGDGEDLARESLTLAVFQNGTPIPISVLNRWAREQGPPGGSALPIFRFPNVAAGEYRVCVIPASIEIALPWSILPGGLPCASGVLAPGSLLSLHLKPSS